MTLSRNTDAQPHVKAYDRPDEGCTNADEEEDVQPPNGNRGEHSERTTTPNDILARGRRAGFCRPGVAFKRECGTGACYFVIECPARCKVAMAFSKSFSFTTR